MTTFCTLVYIALIPELELTTRVLMADVPDIAGDWLAVLG